MEEPLSKTRRKKDMHALQALGAELAALSEERIRALKLPEPLERALLEVKGFKAHGAVRRQQQYIGKLMREVDPEPLRAYLDQLAGSSRAATAALHQAERWRERLLSDLNAVDAFVTQFPATDRQALRQLVQAAKREQEAAKPPRRYRELFRAIADALQSVSTHSDHD